MPNPISDRIVKHIAGPKYRPQKVRSLARSMGVEEDEYAEFRGSVKSLMHSGRIVLGRGNAVMLPRTPGTMVGTYRANPRGFGFVVPESPDEHGDLYVPKGEALDAVAVEDPPGHLFGEVVGLESHPGHDSVADRVPRDAPEHRLRGAPGDRV